MSPSVLRRDRVARRLWHAQGWKRPSFRTDDRDPPATAALLRRPLGSGNHRERIVAAPPLNRVFGRISRGIEPSSAA